MSPRHPSLLQAIQLKYGDGGDTPISQFNANRWGLLATAFSACPLAMHIVLLLAAVLTSHREGKRKGALEIVYLLPTKPHWFVAFQGFILL